jgi:mono/diheme cytochrome c family protein
MDALKDAIKHTITNNHVHEVIMSRMNSITALWAAVAVAAAAVSVTIVITAAPQAAHGVERAVLPAATSTGEAGAAISIERGRYVAQISGCNDCHTAGYAMSGGKVPQSEWLKGDALGWRGPWGTTYPANLRLTLVRYSEDQWVEVARSAQYRPPMPWFSLRDMNEADLRSLYRFVRSLGEPGAPAPAYVPPPPPCQYDLRHLPPRDQ